MTEPGFDAVSLAAAVTEGLALGSVDLPLACAAVDYLEWPSLLADAAETA